MRLIDADKLELKHFVQRVTEQPISYEGTQPIYANYDIIDYDVDNAPTVNAIPIDKPFLKMRYGDYVVYNKKWLVNHLQTEWNILQGKEYQPSIPIEWIKKWCNEEHNRKSLEERLLKRYGVITMLEDWEKENQSLE